MYFVEFWVNDRLEDERECDSVEEAARIAGEWVCEVSDDLRAYPNTASDVADIRITKKETIATFRV